MIIITEGKQVGELSYMTDYIETLLYILDDEEIYRSRETEYNPNDKKKEHYISFSRNLTAAAKRNPKRWRFGVIVDGDKLSERYNITPISFAGTTLSHKEMKVKYITAYDNGTYALSLVHWPTIPIDEHTYNAITYEIEAMPEEDKIKHKLIYSGEGKNVVNGRKVKEKFLFNVPTGGLRINYNKYPEISNAIANNTNINEEEERIWIRNNDYYIDISSCIKGIIIPTKLIEEEQEDFVEVKRAMNKLGITRIVKY